jgi:phosphatidylserine/phosphatidylglycerophosphate/cardiolipin synthase-like enzyme
VRRVRVGAIAIAVLAIVVFVVNWLGIRPPRSAPIPAVDHDPVAGISVYFSSPGRQPPSPNRIDEAFIRFLSGAVRSIDVAIYLIDDPQIVSALIAAQSRGVVVRMVTDSDTLDRPRSDGLRQAMASLRQAGIPIVGDQRQGIMHHKFAVRDRAEVWTGSWNMTENDSTRMNNAAIWLRSKELAANFLGEFEQMFSDRRFSQSKSPRVANPRVNIDGAEIETYFQPRNAGMAQLISRVDIAQQSVHFLAFSFTHQGLSSSLRNRTAAGVEVQGVMERAGSESVYSQMRALRDAQVDVRTDANPSLMHHKSFIMDGRIVATGSMNYSLSVTRSNDENLLLIDDPRVARVFEMEFAAIADEARSGRLRSSTSSASMFSAADESPLDD